MLERGLGRRCCLIPLKTKERSDMNAVLRMEVAILCLQGVIRDESQTANVKGVTGKGNRNHSERTQHQ
jgi:hypothetical protein